MNILATTLLKCHKLISIWIKFKNSHNSWVRFVNSVLELKQHLEMIFTCSLWHVIIYWADEGSKVKKAVHFVTHLNAYKLVLLSDIQNVFVKDKLVISMISVVFFRALRKRSSISVVTSWVRENYWGIVLVNYLICVDFVDKISSD